MTILLEDELSLFRFVLVLASSTVLATFAFVLLDPESESVNEGCRSRRKLPRREEEDRIAKIEKEADRARGRSKSE